MRRRLPEGPALTAYPKTPPGPSPGLAPGSASGSASGSTPGSTPGLAPGAAARLAVLALSGAVFFAGPAFFLDVRINAPFALTLALGFLVAGFAVARRHLALMYYMHFLIFVVFFAYYLQTAIGIRFVMGSASIDDFGARAAWMFAAHLTALALGHARFRRRPAPHLAPRPVPKLRHGANIAVVTGLVTGAVGLVVGLAGPEAFLGTRADLYRQGFEISGPMRIAILVAKAMPYVLAILILEAALERRGRGHGRGQDRGQDSGLDRAIWLILFAVVLGAALLLANPTNTGRFVAVSTLSMVVFYALMRLGEPRRLVGGFVMATPYLFLVVLPVTSLMRFGTLELDAGRWALSFSTLEFSALQLFADAARDIDPLGCCSNHTLSAALIFVPAELWPGKATGTGVEIAAANGYVFHNVAVPSFIDFGIDFGLAGIFVLSLAMGRALAWADPAHRNPPAFLERRTGYAVMLLALVPILVRGDLATFFVAFYALAAGYEAVRLMATWRLG